MTSRWRGRKVCYRHVERSQNRLADWLANMALNMGRTVMGVEQQFPNLQEEHAPPTQLDLPEGQVQSEAAKWETVVGDR